MMYQEPMDMMIRMISVPRETKSPCFHGAWRPYGFSTTSLVVVASWPAPAGGAGTAAGFGASAVAGAGAAPVAWAYAALGATTSAAADARPRTAATSSAGSRLMGFIV